jgi:hypothetical protein
MKEAPTEALAQMMYDHAEMRRKEKVKAAKGERKMIMDYLDQLQLSALQINKDDGGQSIKSGNNHGSVSPAPPPHLKGLQKLLSPTTGQEGQKSNQIEDAQGATMMELEKKRLENLQKRQQKEIQQMMDYELKVKPFPLTLSISFLPLKYSPFYDNLNNRWQESPKKMQRS